MGCALCKNAADPLLVEGDADGAILVDRAPMCFGHLLVVSPTHCSSVLDLPAAHRERLWGRVETAREIAAAVAGRPAVALEHGRSPTCGDPSCACHAHVHVIPLGSVDVSNLVEDHPLIRPIATAPTDGPYVTISEAEHRVRHFETTRPMAHAARTVAALCASEACVDWRPLALAGSDDAAAATLRAAKAELLRRARSVASRSLRGSNKPTVFVSGSTGSGKTTVARHLADKLGVPAVELGVILRLACLHDVRRSERTVADMLWTWARSKRIDFDGLSQFGLAAAVPRLDGGSHETLLWTEVEAERLAALANSDDVQEALSAIALWLGRRHGAVVVGRVPVGADVPDAYAVHLDANAGERIARKRRQLSGIGLGVAAHDWFNPALRGSQVPRPASYIDTTGLSPGAMVAIAWRHLGVAAQGQLRLAS